MVWLAIYNSQLFDIECVSCHLQYASDVDNKTPCGIANTYIKCRYVKTPYEVHSSHTRYDMKQVCVGDNGEMSMLDALKRRRRDKSFMKLLHMYSTYKSIEKDIVRYEKYRDIYGPNGFGRFTGNIYDALSEVSYLGFLFDDDELCIDGWHGSIYGYLTPFECRLIKEFLVGPTGYGVADFIISKRVFKFICKCTVIHLPYWYVPVLTPN